MKNLLLLLLFFFSVNFINAQINLQDGLITYYPFSTNALDASGNGNDGIINGAKLTEDKEGNPNSAFLFDGIDDFIEVPDNLNLRLGTEYSISLWAFVNEFSNENTHAFLSKRDWVDDDGYMFQIIGHSHVHDEPQGRIGLIAGSENPRVDSEAKMDEGEWFHVVLQSSFEKGESRVYINGKLDGSGDPIIPNNQTTENLFIGKDKLTEDPIFLCCDGFHFNGAMDEIRIYNRCINEEEITALFEKVNTSNEHFESKISIYPNPASNHLIIKNNENLVERITIQTIDGKAVFSTFYQEKINLPYLTSGLYLVELIKKDGKTLKIEKLIISNSYST
jgi:hypothetical protein